MKQIDLVSTDFGTRLKDAGFVRVNSRRYLRVTRGDIAQRIELRPNRHGGELTCDLTIHPLFAHERVHLDVLEPGIWIRTLCTFYGESAPTWFERNHSGVQQLVDSIADSGLQWFDDNSTAEGIIESATKFVEPWRNEQFVHVDLGHCYLRAGRFDDALRVFDRKPSRVPRYKSLSTWIAKGNTIEIQDLHCSWTESSMANLPVNTAEPCDAPKSPVGRKFES